MEQKKSAAKLGNNLKRIAARVAKKATKDKHDAKDNLKAKDVLLKQARKDAKKAAAVEAEGSAKKKRKVSPNAKPQNSKQWKRRAADEENSEDDEDHCGDSDDSDSDDSDWEGGKTKPKRPATKESGDAAIVRRHTRVRASTWTGSRCALDNFMKDDECAQRAGNHDPVAFPTFEQI